MDPKYYVNINDDFFSYPSTIRDYIKNTPDSEFSWTEFLTLLRKAEYKYVDKIGLVTDVIAVYQECLKEFNTPKVLNEEEECILNIRDVAEYFATKELKSLYSDFTIEKYSFQLESLIQEIHKTLQTFKRT